VTAAFAVLPLCVAGQEALAIEEVREGLHVISGAGGNIALRFGEDGVVLVDAGSEGRFAEVERLVASVTAAPIRYVINTHLHPDHTGGNAAVAENATIVGHVVTRDLMRSRGMPHTPRATFTQDTTLVTGSLEVRVLHLGAGHTGGDAIVYFPDLRVVHVGDLLHEISPFIDYEHGGSSAAWVTALNRVLDLDFDAVIVGHGTVMNRNDVLAFRDQMETVRSRFRDMISNGALRRDVGPGILSADLSWTQYRSGGFYRSLAGLYEEVAAELGRGRGGRGQR
jgi:glyoxylase-like metal-dependent hydrolase (beta-lactamase superfamily II)